MPRHRVIPSVVLATAAALLLGACGSPMPVPAPTPTETIAPSGDGVLRLGTMFSTTGTFAFLGPAQVAGVELAVREINAAGGVNGAPVEVLHRDSADAGSTVAETSLADLVAKGTDVIIGPTSSVIAERVMPAVVAAKVAMISPAATFPALTGIKDSGYFFRTIPAYGHQGVALGQVLSEKGPAKVALVYSDDELGQSVEATLSETLADEGSELVASEPVAAATTDFAPVIAAVVKAKPDVVVLATAYSSLDATKALINQLFAAGLGGAKLWLTTQNTGDYSQAFPQPFLAGVNGIIEGFEPDDAFKARLKQADPALGTFRYAAEAYDATILAALAAIVAKDDSGRSVAAALGDVSRGGIKCTSFGECLDVLKTRDDIDYDGISGPANFTTDGDVAPAFYGIYTYNTENKFVLSRGVVAG